MHRKGSKRTVIVACITMLAVMSLLVSCSTKVKDPESAIDRMVKAYGGPDRVKFISTYSGKGFMRKLPIVHVAESYAFDIYQKEALFKSVVMNVKSGMLTDVRIHVTNSDESFQWSYSEGRKPVPQWQSDLFKYRFPYVFAWLRETSGGELLEAGDDEAVCRVRYTNNDDIITLVIDKKSWLLKETVVESVSDSAFVSRDVYSDYRKVDGIFFPARFTGYMRGKYYYEYYLTKVEFGIEIPDDIFAVTAADTAKIYIPGDITTSK